MKPVRVLAQLTALSTVYAASLRQSVYTDQLGLQNPLLSQDETQRSERKYEIPEALEDMLSALSAMQSTYYDLLAGTWVDAIDWTAAVMGTHVSATLSSLVNGLSRRKSSDESTTCSDLLGWENTVNKYFAQTSVFYFAENAFGLRNQAYDDMLWVVLGWLENVKFTEVYASKPWEPNAVDGSSWHGLQFTPLAAHRARIFYELAEHGWDERLCGGGMIWNPVLVPYKNAITNELFAAASIAMYLYYPGDNNTSPFKVTELASKPHNPVHLRQAIDTYKWIQGIGLTNDAGLYQDGYHISGWHKYRNGTINPGSKKCDQLDKMVYTYNQGVLLSASRGLWLATGKGGYLNDGHELIEKVIQATGWPHKDRHWRGLGRGGVLEEFCDHGLYCSQDGQTFKGIFFHHLTEFCRPLWTQEEELLVNLASSIGYDEDIYREHMLRCEQYGAWIERNAKAVMKTKNKDGLFGMWWGIPTHRPRTDEVLTEGSQELPEGAEDYRNPLPESTEDFEAADLNDRGRGRTVETQSGGLAVLRARWQWQSVFSEQSDLF